MNATEKKRIVVLGYGNPGRKDDGLGPALAAAIAAQDLPDVTIEEAYQLNIEDAATLSAHEEALFVDASVTCAPPFEFRRATPAASIAFTSHAVDPESVLAICEENFRPAPQAWVLAIRGYDFALGEGLSPGAARNLEEATGFVQSLICRWRTKTMEASSSHRKTILTIDDDADVRAALRVVLQAEGFTVGEAASGEEGLKVAKNIHPDAVVVDLMMEKVDSGQHVAQELRESGYEEPIYLLSSVGDAVRHNIDARALGLSGIFQKPVDPKDLVDTLKARLLPASKP